MYAFVPREIMQQSFPIEFLEAGVPYDSITLIPAKNIMFRAQFQFYLFHYCLQYSAHSTRHTAGRLKQLGRISIYIQHCVYLVTCLNF